MPRPIKLAIFHQKSKEKAALFAALSHQADQVTYLRVLPMALRGYPEARKVSENALKTAQHQVRNPVLRALKHRFFCIAYNGTRRFFERRQDWTACAWNGSKGVRQVFMQAARDAGASTLFAELSPLPETVTLDPNGVNARNSLPRQAAPYLEWAKEAHSPAMRWQEVAKKIASRQGGTGAPVSASTRFVFCPLQIPYDSQVMQHAGWVGNMEGFIQAVCRASLHLPPGWKVRIKEHPGSKVSFSEFIMAQAANTNGSVILDNSSDTIGLVKASDGVVTLNSSVGLEALFFEKPVIVLGDAFYKIDGLVQGVETQKDLEACFSSLPNITAQAALRDAYLNFLLNSYYPKFTRASDGQFRLQEGALMRAIAR